MDHILGPNGPVWAQMAPPFLAAFQQLRFSTTSAPFLAHMVSEMAQKPSKCEEHIYSKRLRPKNKNGQNYPTLGLIDGGGTLK